MGVVQYDKIIGNYATLYIITLLGSSPKPRLDFHYLIILITMCPLKERPHTTIPPRLLITHTDLLYQSQTLVALGSKTLAEPSKFRERGILKPTWLALPDLLNKTGMTLTAKVKVQRGFSVPATLDFRLTPMLVLRVKLPWIPFWKSPQAVQDKAVFGCY